MALWEPHNSKDTDAYTTPEEQMQKAANIMRRSRKINLIAFVVIVAAVFIYGIFFQTKSINAAMDDSSFALVTLEDEVVSFSLTEIESVELGTDFSSFDRGTLQTGTEDSTVCSGTYLNDAFGTYQLHVNLNVEYYVIVCYTDDILVFNTSTADETNELYTKILDTAVS